MKVDKERKTSLKKARRGKRKSVELLIFIYFQTPENNCDVVF